MTDRYYAITVALESDIREDDEEALLNAIKMLKGVLSVEPHIGHPDIWVAEERARHELKMKIFELFRPKIPGQRE
jgi:hypothetical protein